MSPQAQRVIVVGGGVAGLLAARRHALAGADVLVLESAPELGGAVAAVLEGRITNGTTVAALLALQALRGGGAPAAALRPADAPFMERPGRG